MTKTIVVTGGGTGIGKAIAQRFAQDGMKVIITGRRAELLEHTAREIGSNVVAKSFDAADPDQVAEFASGTGTVDVLVNNAGGNTDFDRPTPSNLGEVANAWRANLAANVITAVLTTTALLPSMRRGGAIITIGSIAADKGAGSYGASKAAVASWNVDLASEVGPLGLTANIVSPGYIEDTEFFRDVLTGEGRASMVAAITTARAGTPDDVAATVAFLASDGARQITGQAIAVNGGERTSR